MKRKFGILALFSVLTLIITSCGGSGTTTTPPPTPADFTIAVSNPTPSIEEGGTTTVTLTVTSTDSFSDQVALSITKAPEVTTASFNPATTTTTSVLTLASATAGIYSMPISATGGGITKNATVTLTVTAGSAPPPPTTSTITGKVLDIGGQPVSNAAVVVLGQDPATQVLTTTALTGITNSDGEFTIAGVKKPYDISAISTIGGPISTTYLGLTIDNPELFVLDFSLVPGNSAILKGDTSSLPTPFNQHMHRGAFGSPEVLQPFKLGTGGLYRDINTNLSNVDVNWFGSSVTTGMTHVLQWKEQSTTNPLPLSYTGYGKIETILTNNGTANNQDVTLTPLGSSNAGGSITMPTGYTLNNKNMMVELDANTRITFAEETNTNLNFNYVTPQINDSKVSFGATATGLFGRKSSILRQGLSPSDTNIAITIPDAPSLALPANGAPNVSYNTDFEWAPSDFTDSVNIVSMIAPTGIFFVITSDSKFKLPDLSAQGMPINPAFGAPGTPIPYIYNVQSLGPLSDADAAASPSLLKLFNGELLNSDMVLGQSQTFNFSVPSK